jgi:hypothetical protein
MVASLSKPATKVVDVDADAEVVVCVNVDVDEVDENLDIENRTAFFL